MKVRFCDNETEWNQAVVELNGSLYQSWQWGESRRPYGFGPWRILGETDGRPRAAIQVLERRAPLGCGVHYAPHGIASKAADADEWCEFVSWLRRFLDQRKAAFLRVDPAILDSDEESRQVLTQAGFRSLPDKWSIWGNLPRFSMFIDLHPSSEELLRTMRSRLRRYIRNPKAELTLESGTDAEHMERLHRLVSQTGARRSFAVRNSDFFQHLRRHLVMNERGMIHVARYQGRVIGALLATRFGKVCYALYAGSDQAFSNLHPMEILYWNSILWAKQNGCDKYDMRFVPTAYPPTEGNRGYGLYRFKRGFGAQERYCAGYFDLVGSPLRWRMFRWFETKAGARIYALRTPLKALLDVFRKA